jgi:hypothetical protein
MLAAGLQLLAAAGCRSATAAVLEQKDVQNFSVSAPEAPGLRLVRVTGLAMHSALAVERVETQTEAGTVRIRVVMALAKQDQAGTFDVVVQVPASVKQVGFGDERTVIWPAKRTGD